MKLFGIAVVVNSLDNYLQDPVQATLAERVINVMNGIEAPNPDYAAMKQPFQAVIPAAIPESKAGDVVFLEYKGGTSFEVVGSLTNFPTQDRIRNAYLAILNAPLHPGEGAQLFDTTGNNLPLGLGLIHLPFNFPDFLPNLPAILWLLIALYTGYSAYNTRRPAARIAWGAAAWLAAAKYVKTQKQNIKL